MANLPISSEGPSETKNTRVTVDGRKLSYHLHVIQQPEQARACGQGAKSSSDRRPVDPPPIVELKVLQGDDMRDITFDHNADFFVNAYLENDRPMASGRGAQPSGSNLTIAGSSVAGISYLDRPQKAGYFLFPDLSVRHEGVYRLNFMLYERIKEAKDADSEHQSLAQPAEPVTEFVYARTSVKSQPFTVYSAKKFPGLKESTSLSRIVADQGCRVRIRRDARVRKRSVKREVEMDYDNDEAILGRQAIPGMKDGQPPSQRSSLGQSHPNPTQNPSNGSQPNFPSASRPGDMQPPQPQDPTSPYGYPPSMDYTAPRMLQTPQYGYGPPPPSVPQSPSSQSPYTFPQQSLLGQGPSYNSNTNSYISHQRSSSATHPYSEAAGAPLNSYDNQYHRTQSSQQAAYGSGEGPSKYGIGDPNPMYTRPLNIPGGSFSNNSAGNTISPQRRNPDESSLPPLITNGTPEQSRYNKSRIPSPLSAPPTGRPSTSNSAYANMPQSAHATAAPALPPITPSTQTFYPPDPNTMGNKRSFGTVFNTQHTEQPMRAGSRPQPEGNSATYSDSFPTAAELDWQEADTLQFSYKRADGTMQFLCPTIPKRG